VCKHCSPDCSVNLLSSYAVKKGYKCYIVPGGEMLFNIVEREKPGAILGVACHHEMAQPRAPRRRGVVRVVRLPGRPAQQERLRGHEGGPRGRQIRLDLEGPPPGAAPASAARSASSAGGRLPAWAE